MVFLKVLELSQTSDTPPRMPAQYLSAIARNVAVDLLRSRRRSLFMAEPIDQAPDVWHTFDTSEEITLAELRAYIAALPSELAAVFTMRFVRNLSQARVCQEMAISRQQLRTLETRVADGAFRHAGQERRGRRAAEKATPTPKIDPTKTTASFVYRMVVPSSSDDMTTI